MIDRADNGPYDTRILLTYKMAPKRLYSAAGGGYFESFDYGQSWNSPSEGIDHRYLFSMAVNTADPQNVIVSAARGAWKAHCHEEISESFLYMRSKDGEKWNLVTDGLPESNGTIISMLAANPKIKGEFYCKQSWNILFC